MLGSAGFTGHALDILQLGRGHGNRRQGVFRGAGAVHRAAEEGSRLDAAGAFRQARVDAEVAAADGRDHAIAEGAAAMVRAGNRTHDAGNSGAVLDHYAGGQRMVGGTNHAGPPRCLIRQGQPDLLR